MGYGLSMIWHERQRYLPGVLAVAFSAVLIALQCGLLLGLFSITSIPIDHTRADVWIGSADVLSVDLGRPIPAQYISRLASEPGVEPPEVFLQGFSSWTKPSGGTDLCIVIGSRLDDDSLGALADLTPELRAKLSEPGTVVVDESELGRLGVSKIGDTGEILGKRVRIVGLTNGLKSMAGPYVFCSLRTARPLIRYRDGEATFFLARCKDQQTADRVVQKLRDKYTDLSAFTSTEFSVRSRIHWLTKTRAGIALGYAALLGLLVGGVVTSQTLYAATAASLREFAVLRALGIPRWRMGMLVLSQAFWVGLVGIAIAVPASFGLAHLADVMGAKVILPFWLLAAAAAITVLMAVSAGLAALRSLRLIDPAILLR